MSFTENQDGDPYEEGQEVQMQNADPFQGRPDYLQALHYGYFDEDPFGLRYHEQADWPVAGEQAFYAGGMRVDQFVDRQDDEGFSYLQADNYMASADAGLNDFYAESARQDAGHQAERVLGGGGPCREALDPEDMQSRGPVLDQIWTGPHPNCPEEPDRLSRPREPRPYENFAEAFDAPHKVEPEDGTVNFLRGLAAAFEVSLQRLFRGQTQLAQFDVTFAPSRGGYKRGACIRIRPRKANKKERPNRQRASPELSQPPRLNRAGGSALRPASRAELGPKLCLPSGLSGAKGAGPAA